MRASLQTRLRRQIRQQPVPDRPPGGIQHPLRQPQILLRRHLQHVFNQPVMKPAPVMTYRINPGKIQKQHPAGLCCHNIPWQQLTRYGCIVFPEDIPRLHMSENPARPPVQRYHHIHASFKHQPDPGYRFPRPENHVALLIAFLPGIQTPQQMPHVFLPDPRKQRRLRQKLRIHFRSPLSDPVLLPLSSHTQPVTTLSDADGGHRGRKAGGKNEPENSSRKKPGHINLTWRSWNEMESENTFPF